MQFGERPPDPVGALRQIVDGGGVTLAASICDALSAQLAARVGFKVAILGGSNITNTLLGLPNAGLLTLSEMEFVLSRATQVSPIPIIADADTGYGNAISVIRTTRVLERAGAAGMQLEDQVFPKRGPDSAAARIVSTAEMVGKIQAAVDARANSGFAVIVRTDAHRVDGLSAAIERLNRYVEAGADGIQAMLPGRADYARVGAEVPARLKVAHLGRHSQVQFSGAADPARISLDELGEMGWNAAMPGANIVRAAALAMFRYLDDLRARSFDADVALERELEGSPFADWLTFTGLADVRQLEAKYRTDGV